MRLQRAMPAPTFGRKKSCKSGMLKKEQQGRRFSLAG
jgi:hypothetical protein